MDKQQALKWSKRIAAFAVVGVTGVAALLVYNLYRTSKGLEKITLDDLKL
jgi:hypothetical protein